MEVGSIFDIDIKKLFEKTKKEIKFPLEKNNKFKEKKFFNTGRSAIEFLFKYQIDFENKDIVLIPNFICLSVVQAIERANIKYEYYRVKSDFQIDIEDLEKKINKNVKAIFYINYFGFVQKKENVEILEKLKKQYLIIEDNTQALFSANEYIRDRKLCYR